MGGIYTSIIGVNPETSTGHTLLVIRQIKFQHNNLIKIEKWLKGIALNKWESTLNLCVHAHGYDVGLIMKASCNDNYPLGINSSCTYDRVHCDHGFYHDVLLWFHFANNMEHLSSTSQQSNSYFIMFYLRVITPLVSRRYCGIAPHLVDSSWCDTSDRFANP